jgi:cell wall assembly regulator SMI1
MTSVKPALDRIEGWLTRHGTSLELAPPASRESIAAAEAKVGFTLPADYVELLLFHDGQQREDVSWLPGGGRLHAIDDCVRAWQDQQGSYEPSNPVVPEPERERYRQLVFHPRWLPIGGNEHWDGDNLVCDMFPAKNGREGQIVGFVTECDVLLLGESITGFLERYVALIEAGRLDCIRVEGQDYAFEVVPSDRAKRTVYQSRWDSLFDPRKPVTRARARRSPAAPP